MAPTRDEIFEQAAQRMRSEFNELVTVPHNALSGAEAERILRSFLNEHLPKRFAAGAGFILDKRDEVSPQTDVIIYDALNCPVYRASDEAAIIPNDNVAAVVEVKSSLTKERLEGAAAKIAACKKLLKSPAPEVPFLVQTGTLGAVFAFESAISLEKIAEHYDACTRSSGLGPQIDHVVLLDVGIVMLSAWVPQTGRWSPIFFEGPGGAGGEGAHVAVGSAHYGAATLDVFLRYLLAHLTYFRGIVDHPGFHVGPTAAGTPVNLRYLTSLTQETDPVKREQKLREYREHAKTVINGR